jgi:putative toxin-antitoxin system antitoxin component (TIGR02293 family)
MSTAALRKSTGIATVQEQIGRIQAGLSFKAVRSLQAALDLPLEKIAAFLGMSRATFHRRKSQGKIARNESEKLVRYQRLVKKAEEVLGGSAAAREWLTHSQPALGNVKPVEFARTEIGAREVENLLGRIEYGVYS